jgi:hypothetical protein
MKIYFTPQSRFETLTVSRYGDVLDINGTVLDLSTLMEGEALPVYDEESDALLVDTGSPWLLHARRHDGRIEATLLLPISADAPESARFPQPLVLDGDGPVPLPG